MRGSAPESRPGADVRLETADCAARARTYCPGELEDREARAQRDESWRAYDANERALI
jgi:hypothetical protein